MFGITSFAAQAMAQQEAMERQQRIHQKIYQHATRKWPQPGGISYVATDGNRSAAQCPGCGAHGIHGHHCEYCGNFLG
jgi:methionyl-tRNA synthetase